MAVLLRIIDGPQAGASCEVREGQSVVLGRGEHSDFHILDSWASRRHCTLTYQPDGIVLEDLSTKNGTYVSGKPITRVRLADGSLVQIGTTTVQVFVHATRSTVAAMPGAVGFRARGGRPRRRVGLVVGAAAVLLVGAAFGGFMIFGPGRGGKGGGGLALFGGPSKIPIELTSQPAGATVFIDDEYRGVTPLGGIELLAGEHVLRVQKAGYTVHREALTMEGRREKPIHIVLKLAERGTLVVASKPDGAAVHLNGEYRGNTPLRIDDLEPETYSLRVLKKNFADWQRDVAITPNETVSIEAALGHREIGYYENALKKDPNNVSYHTEVAHLYLLEHKLDACMGHLAQAVEITIAGNDTTTPEAYTARLTWLLQKIYFNDHFTYGDAAFIRVVHGRVDNLLASMASKHPDSSYIATTARKLYKRAGTSLLGKAAAYEAKAKAHPTEFSHTMSAVGFLILSREYGRAEALLVGACKAMPKDHRPFVALGRMHLGAKRGGKSGAREKAIQTLNAALKLCTGEPERAEIRRLLGEATR